MAALLAVAVFTVAAGEVYSIPKDKIDAAAIYWGDPSEFTNPACVNYTALIESTPEYKEMKKKKLSSSDPASWILMSDAADRVSSAIVRFAKQASYDLICSKEYWQGLKIGVAAPDITSKVKENIEKKE
jgi:hypothetical protein